MQVDLGVPSQDEGAAGVETDPHQLLEAPAKHGLHFGALDLLELRRGHDLTYRQDWPITRAWGARLPSGGGCGTPQERAGAELVQPPPASLGADDDVLDPDAEAAVEEN